MKGHPNGFVPVPRAVWSTGVASDPELFYLLMFLMHRAAYMNRQVRLGGEIIELEKGQFITTRENLHCDLFIGNHVPHSKRCSQSKLWRMLQNLSEMNFVSVQNLNSRGTLVTVHCLSSCDDTSGPAQENLNSTLDNDVRREWTENEPKMTPLEESKERKERKKGAQSTHSKREFNIDGVEYPFGFDTEGVRAAIGDWIAYKETFPKAKHYKDPTRQVTHLLRLFQHHGPDAFINEVSRAIGSNWVGLHEPELPVQNKSELDRQLEGMHG